MIYGDAPDLHIAVRIQELYDVDRPPALAGGRATLTVHILGPNQRPVQIIRNLSYHCSHGLNTGTRSLGLARAASEITQVSIRYFTTQPRGLHPGRA